jgi:hypothetical protein
LLDIFAWAPPLKAGSGGCLVFLIEFLSDSSQLSAFELGQLDGSPALGSG